MNEKPQVVMYAQERYEKKVKIIPIIGMIIGFAYCGLGIALYINPYLLMHEPYELENLFFIIGGAIAAILGIFTFICIKKRGVVSPEMYKYFKNK